MKQLTDTTYEQHITASTTPVFVDFFMDSCMPCRMVAPILDKLAPEYVGKVEIVKVRGEDAMQTCQKMGISAVPTFISYKDGKVVGSRCGFLNEKQLRAILDELAA